MKEVMRKLLEDEIKDLGFENLTIEEFIEDFRLLKDNVIEAITQISFDFEMDLDINILAKRIEKLLDSTELKIRKSQIYDVEKIEYLGVPINQISERGEFAEDDDTAIIIPANYLSGHITEKGMKMVFLGEED
jgi:hypothetical protein